MLFRLFLVYSQVLLVLLGPCIGFSLLLRALCCFKVTSNCSYFLTKGGGRTQQRTSLKLSMPFRFLNLRFSAMIWFLNL